MSLSTELAAAQTALAAADIEAHLPRNGEIVRPGAARALRLGAARGRDQRHPPFGRPQLLGRTHATTRSSSPTTDAEPGWSASSGRRMRRPDRPARRQRPGWSGRARARGRRPRAWPARASTAVSSSAYGRRPSDRTDPAAARRRPGPGARRPRGPARPRTRSRRWWPRSAGETRSSMPRARTSADVALLDVEMPGLDGISAAAAARPRASRRAGR